MKVGLYLASSLNGFITRGIDDSDWVDDWEIFTSKIKEYRCIVMGRKTYESAEKLFPYENALNIVLTSSAIVSTDERKYVFLKAKPQEVIKYVQDKGFDQILLIGGTDTVTDFLSQNLVNDIFITFHPYLFGNGKKIFNDIPNFETKLKLVSSTQLKPGLLTLHYQTIINLN